MTKRKLETGDQKLTTHEQPQKAKKHKRNHEVLPILDDSVTDKHATPAASKSIKSTKAEGENTTPNREILERLEILKSTVMEEMQKEDGTLEEIEQMIEKAILQESAPIRQKKKRRKHKYKEDSQGRNENGKDDDQAQRPLGIEKATRSTKGQKEKKHKRRDMDRQRQKRRLREDNIKDNSGKKGQSSWRVSEPIAGHLNDLDPVFSYDEK